jgi:beta-glucosidase
MKPFSSDHHPARLTRRGFLGAGAGAVSFMAATPILGKTIGQTGHADLTGQASFPRDFFWGAATSSYQIEGAAAIEGRKPSVWDTFSKTPGRVSNGDTGDVACDHYHRFEEDVKLMADLGIGHYRFSISWPRVIPDGRGAVNGKGLDFYSRLVDTLLKQNITPHATLFHWDSPQALEDLYGSWRSREIVNDFADYCTATVKHLGDRVTRWMTMNEIICFTSFGYGVNTQPPFAPGTVVQSKKEVRQTIHHALLAHGMACQAIRAASPVKPQVSIVINCDTFVPVMETPEHIAAATRAFLTAENNAGILLPVLSGSYGPEIPGADAPDIREGDMEIIGQPLDALGLNIYTGHYVRAADTPAGHEVLPLPRNYPNMLLPWLNFLPESIYWAIRSVSNTPGGKDLPLYIAENGCPTDDEPTDTGEIIDTARIMYLRSYLRNVLRAVAEGYPVKGYFLWSLMDNFEWTAGYSRRFGLVHVDFKTGKRTPKLSYQWYWRVIREKRIV